MIELVLVGVGALMLFGLLGFAFIEIIKGMHPVDLSKHKMTAADFSAPPPWAAPKFRCPNCSCKWCKFGAKGD